ncbi:MAG TPA: hydantoinase/oxoprolinase family protein [Candidatus Tectomicrobia bacterium]|jgi:N-methylhydantoinase A
MLEIAIDIGGTFTDVVCLQDQQRLVLAKVPTTPQDLVQGVRQGVARVLELVGQPAGAVERFIHSTTVATNAILEHKGAITGVLMTAGFEDALEIGRQKRSNMYDLFLDAETPVFLAPRRQRVGIRERLDATGRVLQPLDEPQVVDAVAMLRQQYGVQSLAVCYLFSFLNPVHEIRTRELLAAYFPDLAVSLSSEVDPVFREYERVCVTAFDAYVRPIVAAYMQRLAEALETMGIRAHLQVMQSRGGLTTVQTVTTRPVSMLLSGPASGVIGGRFAGEQSHLRNVITLDMGGTSCDVALVQEGKPLLCREGRMGRYPLRLPMVDVNTVGAGGGSLAWIDSSGGLRVGPQSAGADPGPACYGRGGTTPTVTDASVVLGYLNPDYFAGGDLALQAEAAHRVIGCMADRLQMTPVALASGIHRIINARMADEIRLVSVRRGYDPRQFALVLLGGAGPVHGGRLAHMLAIPTTVVPVAPGVLSAFGLVVASIEHDHTRTFASKADEVDLGRLHALFVELEQLGQEKMRRDRVPLQAIQVAHYADLRYVGQSYELEVGLPLTPGPASIARAVADFHGLHRQVYGHSRPMHAVEFVNIRTVHSAPLPPPRLAPGLTRGSLAAARHGSRPAYFDEYQAYCDTPVYARRCLPTGARLCGPAIIEQPDTTTVVYPGQHCQVDMAGNLLITAVERA